MLILFRFFAIIEQAPLDQRMRVDHMSQRVGTADLLVRKTERLVRPRPA